MHAESNPAFQFTYIFIRVLDMNIVWVENHILHIFISQGILYSIG